MPGIAIIDADPLCYEVAINAMEIVEIDEGVFTTVYRRGVAESKYARWVEHILEATDCDKAELTFTDRTRNFRTEIYPSYKSNRVQHDERASQKPIYLKLTTEHCYEQFQGWRWSGLEGDDVCGILATSDVYWPGERKVIVSIDKDMKTIPGEYYNPRKPELGVQVVSEEDATFNLMLQTTMGDRVDGYPGCDGLGEKRARAMLEAVRAEGGDYWPVILAAYEKAGHEPDFAITMARCAFILQADHFDLATMEHRLWNPPPPRPQPLTSSEPDAPCSASEKSSTSKTPSKVVKSRSRSKSRSEEEPSTGNSTS